MVTTRRVNTNKIRQNPSSEVALHMSINITSSYPDFEAEEGTYEPTTTDLVLSDMLPIFIFCFIILIFPVWCRAREEGQCDGMPGFFDRLPCFPRRRAQSVIDNDVKKLRKELNHECLYGLEDAVEELGPQDVSAMIYYQSIIKVLYFLLMVCFVLLFNGPKYFFHFHPVDSLGG